MDSQCLKPSSALFLGNVWMKAERKNYLRPLRKSVAKQTTETDVLVKILWGDETFGVSHWITKSIFKNNSEWRHNVGFWSKWIIETGDVQERSKDPGRSFHSVLSNSTVHNAHACVTYDCNVAAIRKCNYFHLQKFLILALKVTLCYM